MLGRHHVTFLPCPNGIVKGTYVLDFLAHGGVVPSVSKLIVTRFIPKPGAAVGPILHVLAEEELLSGEKQVAYVCLGIEPDGKEVLASPLLLALLIVQDGVDN